LALLSKVIEEAQSHGGSRRMEVGRTWVLDDDDVEVRSEEGPFPVMQSQGKTRITPHVAGRYDIRRGSDVESRYAVVPAREVDLRPRNAAGTSLDSGLGTQSTTTDISRWVALTLLALLSAEIVLRALMRRARDRLN
jgi:hypothetical protein